MRDIFIGYKTGSREWTYDRKRFSEGEFRLVFGPILPNELIHEAAAAFLAVTHLDVILFSVPMNLSHPGLPAIRFAILEHVQLSERYPKPKFGF